MNEHFSLLVVGSGGTGTYFLKEISRFLSGNTAAANMISKMVICDGDIVEGKNLSRQCFSSEDIGRKKAVVMAEILNLSFQLNWSAYPKYLSDISDMDKFFPKDSKNVPVIIGCVDNHGARLLMEDFFSQRKDCIYFDAANEFSNGEAVFAYKADDIVLGPCRSSYFPDILKGDTRNVTDISCEELNQVEPQHILANMAAGMQLLSAFINLLNGKATPGVTYFNPFEMYTEFVPYHSNPEDRKDGCV